jgi:hypothetical protein
LLLFFLTKVHCNLILQNTIFASGKRTWNWARKRCTWLSKGLTNFSSRWIWVKEISAWSKISPVCNENAFTVDRHTFCNRFHLSFQIWPVLKACTSLPM